MLAANEMYTKLSHTIELKHPVFQQSFNEAGQFADGYIALYYLQSYSNPKYIDWSVEMIGSYGMMKVVGHDEMMLYSIFIEFFHQISYVFF